jgi:transcriptional regulator with GAF, ATPase, and Fis domain
MRTKPLVFVLGLAIVCYAVVVVGYAHQATEIGVTCAFETRVQGINERYIPREFAAPQPPKQGDEVVEVAGVPIVNWSTFLRTVARLHSEALFPRTIAAAATTLADLEDLADTGHSVVRRGNQDLVRIRYLLAEGSGAQGHCWCVIGTPPPDEFLPSLTWFFLKMGLFVIGALVLWRRPHDEAAYRFFLLCVCAVGAYMGGYHWLRIASSPPLILIFMICAMMLPAVSLHFYLVYPSKKAFLRNHPRLTLGLLYGPPVALLMGMVATLFAVIYMNRSGLYAPSEVAAGSQLLLYEIRVAIGMALVWFLACIASLVHSLAAAPQQSQARNQVKWILAGALLAAIPIAYTLYLAFVESDRFGIGGATWPMFAASICISVAYAVSISRYGLMEVRDVLNLGVLSLGASVGAALIFTGIVFLGTFFLDSQGINLSPLWHAAWISVVAWLIFTALHLARTRLRLVLHRRLHRTKFQLDQTLRRMSEAVEQRIDPQLLCRRFLTGLAEVAGFDEGAIYLRQGEPAVFRLATCLGDEPPVKELPPGSPLIDTLQHSPLLRLRRTPGTVPLEPALRQLKQLGGVTALPLRHEGQMLAVLLIGPMESGDTEIESLHLLTTFAQIAGMALHAAHGHEDLERLHLELQTKVAQIAEQQRRIVALQTQLQQRQSVTPMSDGEAKPAAALTAVDQPNSVPPSQMIGGSEVMRHLLHMTKKVAAGSSAVLIRGESGTGKELLARAIHDWGPRARGPFVKVHCAALAPGLLESELFGHVKGAFTSAIRNKVGRFEMADGGTLFLDEIGDISLEIQTKLLRVLQEMSFERVGSSTPIMVDVRVVAATNQDLEKLMREARFREDLFFRLNVITLRTPTLRERREDIVELAHHFLRHYAAKNGKPGVAQFEDDVLVALKSYSWPGNVRELENVIERAAVLADGAAITLAELPEEVRRAADEGTSTLRLVEPAGRNGLEMQRDWQAQQEEAERRRLVQALATAHGNKARAARALGMPRTTFISKLEKHGLVPGRL